MIHSSNALNLKSRSSISFNMMLDHVHVYYMMCIYHLSFLTNLSPFLFVKIRKWLNSYLGHFSPEWFNPQMD